MDQQVVRMGGKWKGLRLLNLSTLAFVAPGAAGLHTVDIGTAAGPLRVGLLPTAAKWVDRTALPRRD